MALSTASDIEKGEKFPASVNVAPDIQIGESESSDGQQYGALKTAVNFLLSSGVELRGVEPVPPELRTDSAFNKIFTMWCTSLLCPLP
jgi:hypothetical protein